MIFNKIICFICVCLSWFQLSLTQFPKICFAKTQNMLHYGWFNSKLNRKETVTMKKIISEEKYCMGCGLCEVYCTVSHSKTHDIIKAYTREQPKPFSRINLEIDKPVSFALQCRHCEDAPCVNACLSVAMQKDENSGLVIHNYEKCIGCWTCIMVCPFGAIKKDSSGKAISKCDLCSESVEPACVANCPNRALIYKEVKK